MRYCPTTAALRCSLALVAAVFLLTAAPDARAQCVKVVLNALCLGAPVAELRTVVGVGDFTALEAGKAADSAALANGSSHSFSFQGNPMRALVSRGRVHAITRIEAPGDWLNYIRWKSRLIRVYGQGRDLSTLPSFASSRNTRERAVARGEGRAQHQWSERDFTVSLIWSHPHFLEIEYRLQGQSGAAAPGLEGL